MKNSAVAIMVSIALLLSGCTRHIVKNSEYNLMIIVDEDFIKQQTQYEWWPKAKKSASSRNAGGGINFPSTGGKEGLILVAVVIAAAIVLTAAVATIHNIKGTNVDIIIQGDSGEEKFGLNWGINKFLISEKTLSSLEKGTAQLKIAAKGTREVEVEVPIEGMRIKRDVHIMEFTGDGKVIVDGMKINSH